jgi:endosialidase-like protein
MASARPGLKVLVNMLGFALVTVVLATLVGAGPAAADPSDTAFGEAALQSNTTGLDDSAFGYVALSSNTTGSFNTANGAGALQFNTMGDGNTASGISALEFSTTGSSNIGLGFEAGNNITTGSNNIDIGNTGLNESNTIRIGTQGTQRKTFIAGISGSGVTGSVVEVTSNGKLGVVLSSARYKRNIRDMGNVSTRLMKLRPVTFRYKNDPSGTLEYGLVAEEVQRVYPNLVTYGPDGKVQSVRYLEFIALLLNELQKQDHQLAAQQREIDALKHKDASINALSERLTALERQVQTASSQGLHSLASK